MILSKTATVMSKQSLVRAMAVAVVLLGFRADRSAESALSRMARTLDETAVVVPRPLEAQPPALPFVSIHRAPTDPPCTDFETRAPIRGRIDMDVIALATHQLNLPMGAGRPLYVKGRQYLFCLEPHYHPPGTTRGPEGWHKGVTVYEIS